MRTRTHIRTRLCGYCIKANELALDIVTFLKNLDNEEPFMKAPEWLPFKDEIESAGPEIASKLGELTGKAAGFFVSSASAATKGDGELLYEPVRDDLRDGILSAGKNQHTDPAHALFRLASCIPGPPGR